MFSTEQQDNFTLHLGCYDEDHHHRITCPTSDMLLDRADNLRRLPVPRRQHLQGVIFRKKRKKSVGVETGSSVVAYPTGSQESVKICCRNASASSALALPRESPSTTTFHYSLIERLTIALAVALRQITVSLSPLPTSSQQQAAAAAATAAETAATKIINPPTASTVSVANAQDAGQTTAVGFLSVLPLSLGQSLRLTLSFCHWTLTFATIFLFIVCLDNLISFVSAHELRSYGAKSEQTELASYMKSPRQLISPAAILYARRFDRQHDRPWHHDDLLPFSGPEGGIKGASPAEKLDVTQERASGSVDLAARTSIASEPEAAAPLSAHLQLDDYVLGESSLDERKKVADDVRVAGQQLSTLPELSFRQSSAISVNPAETSASVAENQWIPIVSPVALTAVAVTAPIAARNQRQQEGNTLLQNGHSQRALNALLDYPVSSSSSPSAASAAAVVVAPVSRASVQRATQSPSSSAGQHSHRNHHQNNNRQATPNRPQTSRSPVGSANNNNAREPLQTLASNYHQRNLYGLSHHNDEPAGHWHLNQHLNQHQHQHNRLAPHYQHRRPRLNNQYGSMADNKITAGVQQVELGKMYKRVLLCDKTLVSLDYLRNLEAEPRPFLSSPDLYRDFTKAPSSSPSPPGPNSPDSHSSSSASDGLFDEILNDIGDNLIDLDGHYNTLTNSYTEVPNANSSAAIYGNRIAAEVSGSLGRPVADSPSRHASQTRATSGGSLPAPSGNGATLDRVLAGLMATTNNKDNKNNGNKNNDVIPSQANSSSSARIDPERLQSQAAATVVTLERRNVGASSYLLSDDDPLVRCDMWDLEKGLKSRKPPEHLLRIAVKADFDTVRDAINRCRQLSERTLPQDDEYRDGLEIMSTEDLVSLFSMKRGLIPGTKWCGLGDQASNYNDLGPKHRIDICCRAHDHCPIRSKPFRNDYGVLNIGLYTKSHCDCDADFYRCLREVRSRAADMLGNLYFNVMKLQCMREERLKVCREAKPIALGFERCIRYEDSPIKTRFKFTTPPVAY